MANRPQTDKLKKLNLFLHSCGMLYSAKPGGVCKRCGPEIEVMPTVPAKPHRSRAAKPVAPVIDESAPPVTTEAQRQRNERAREARAAKRAGLGKPDATAVA